MFFLKQKERKQKKDSVKTFNNLTGLFYCFFKDVFSECFKYLQERKELGPCINKLKGIPEEFVLELII